MTKHADDIGSGRPAKYEWEEVAVDVLNRLEAVEAGGGGGTSNEVTPTSSSISLVTAGDLRPAYLDTYFDGEIYSGADLYMLGGTSVASGQVNLWAYEWNNGMAGMAIQGGDQAVGDMVGFGAVVNDGAGMYLTIRTDQNRTPLRILTNGGADILTIGLNGELELFAVGAGVVMKSPDGTRHRIKIANDGTLSTEVAT